MFSYYTFYTENPKPTIIVLTVWGFFDTLICLHRKSVEAFFLAEEQSDHGEDHQGSQKACHDLYDQSAIHLWIPSCFCMFLNHYSGISPIVKGDTHLGARLRLR